MESFCMMCIESLCPYHRVFLSKTTDQVWRQIVQLTKKAPEASLLKKSVYNCRTSVENQQCNRQDWKEWLPQLCLLPSVCKRKPPPHPPSWLSWWWWPGWTWPASSRWTCPQMLCSATEASSSTWRVSSLLPGTLAWGTTCPGSCDPSVLPPGGVIRETNAYDIAAVPTSGSRCPRCRRYTAESTDSLCPRCRTALNSSHWLVPLLWSWPVCPQEDSRLPGTSWKDA